MEEFEFNGTKGKWKSKPFIGVTSKSNPLKPVYYKNITCGNYIVAKCLSKSKNELIANVKLIESSKETLNALINFFDIGKPEFDSNGKCVSYTTHEVHGKSIGDAFELARKVIEKSLK